VMAGSNYFRIAQLAQYPRSDAFREPGLDSFGFARPRVIR
jgi:hypothetical protein